MLILIRGCGSASRGEAFAQCSLSIGITAMLGIPINRNLLAAERASPLPQDFHGI